ncbi:MAG: hypothetical protein ACFB6R_09770 [Alphaproteobacteria bacterium]
MIGGVFDFGAAMERPWLEEFVFSADDWRFEQTGVIDNFGVQKQLVPDFLLRQQGSFNPNAVRGEVTALDEEAFAAFNAANPGAEREAVGEVLFVNDPYINLDSQEADGIDLGMRIGIDAGVVGTFSVFGDATRLLTLDVVRNEQLVELVNDPAFAGAFAALSVDRLRLNGNPLWRAFGNVRWRKGPFGAGLSVRYVSGFLDTSADPDLDGDGTLDFFPVDSWTRVNLYADHRLDIGPVAPLRLRFGVNNVADTPPPLAHESRGFFTEVHSVRGREFYVQRWASF